MVHCGGWGQNSFGQLGNSTNFNRNQPTLVSGGDTTWINVASGGSHSLGLKADGTLWAWGWNSSGQLGNGSFSNSFSPVQVGSARNWTAISAGGEHSLALKADGTLWAWGQNSSGQIGDNTTNSSEFPVKVGTDKNWISNCWPADYIRQR